MARMPVPMLPFSRWKIVSQLLERKKGVTFQSSKIPGKIYYRIIGLNSGLCLGYGYISMKSMLL